VKVCIGCRLNKPLDCYKPHLQAGDLKQPRCTECLRVYRRVYNKKNKDRENLRKIAWANENREKTLAAKAKWQKTNKGHYNALQANRRARILRATPKWADLNAIKEFYKNCPEGYEVDHIIPLQGKNISGLHVIGNLQYLPKSINRKKSNKYVNERQ